MALEQQQVAVMTPEGTRHSLSQCRVIGYFRGALPFRAGDAVPSRSRAMGDIEQDVAIKGPCGLPDSASLLQIKLEKAYRTDHV